MAQMIPSQYSPETASWAERHLFQCFQAGLGDDYKVIHSLPWLDDDQRRLREVECDFVIDPHPNLKLGTITGGGSMFKENNHRLRFLNEAEIDALLKACSPHLNPIVETALHTGLRRGELLSLKWDQIRNGFIYLTETKSGKARQIPINDRLAEVFREVRRGNQLKSPMCFVALMVCGFMK